MAQALIFFLKKFLYSLQEWSYFVSAQRLNFLTTPSILNHSPLSPLNPTLPDFCPLCWAISVQFTGDPSPASLGLSSHIVLTAVTIAPRMAPKASPPSQSSLLSSRTAWPMAYWIAPLHHLTGTSNKSCPQWNIACGPQPSLPSLLLYRLAPVI